MRLRAISSLSCAGSHPGSTRLRCLLLPRNVEPEALQSGIGVNLFFCWAWRILGKLLANFSANFDGFFLLFRRFFVLVFPGNQPPKKFTPQICRHSSPISLSRTQNVFTPIFCLRGRPRNEANIKHLFICEGALPFQRPFPTPTCKGRKGRKVVACQKKTTLVQSTPVNFSSFPCLSLVPLASSLAVCPL